MTEAQPIADPPLPAPVPSERILPDSPARDRIRRDLGATLIVEAAAGTGKTTELVSRIVAVLREGATELDRIAAVTFTEKAAGEMKLRLRAGLEKARTHERTSGVERERLDRAMAHLEVARIGTIHSLCADLLRERPVEARVDPLFEVSAEDEAERLFEQTFEGWFQEALQRPPEGMRRVLRRKSKSRESRGARELLRDAAWKLCAHRDFTAPWRREPFARDAGIDAVIERLRGLAPLGARAERSGDFLAENFRKVERFLAELDRRELIRARDHDGLEAELAELGRWKEWTWKGGGTRYGKGLLRADIVAERDAVRLDLDRFLEAAGADLAACLYHELSPLIARYAERKARAGKLDFLDLLLSTRDLVKGSRAVREELQARFSHLFVDEFQDTDPLQAEILLLLASDDPTETDWTRARPLPGKLFLVGDPKQSIYRFRRADVALYEEIKERLTAQGASLLYLSTSFRGNPALQDLVNAAFAPAMPGPSAADERPSARSTQARYVALEKFRAPIPDQPALVALPVPRPYAEWGKVSDRAINESLPDAVGAFLDWLIHESGWTVSERSQEGERSPLQARHVCLLFKRFQSYGEDLTRAYVRALEARRIPHVLVGGKSFHDREEVLAVRNALVAIEWPEDELSVYATLRGPFFALPDDALLAYRAATGDGDALGALHPLRHTGELWLRGEATREVAAALAILRKLHLGRNRRPIADTIARLLDATRAHAGIAIWPTGEQALANVLRVMDLARRFEAAGATSFRAFVERMDADALAGQVSEAPVVEEGTEGVRIMTVHRAKGLEFPVVVLADPTAKASFSQPTLHVDQAKNLWAEALGGHMPVELIEQRDEVLRRDREETIRLAYVATTRARDLLVVPAVGDAPIEGWLSVLTPVLYPPSEARRKPEPAPGCPLFGDDSVLDRPLRAEREASDSVAPGQHAPRAGEHRVVWWDPSILGLDKQPEGGLRQQRILAADDGGLVSEEGKLAHAAWTERRDELIRTGSVETLPVHTATEIAEQEELDPEARFLDMVEHEDTGVDRRERPRGKRFGTLVHAVLAEVDLEAGPAAVAAVAAAQGRLLGAPIEEVSASATAVVAALAHPLLKRAAASASRGDCRRETPVLLPLPDGSVIEGVIDLAFREPGDEGAAWTVVDFKTDVELEGRRGKYATQVLLYARAIGEATGEPAAGCLLSV